jgi:hypothetical protein
VLRDGGGCAILTPSTQSRADFMKGLQMKKTLKELAAELNIDEKYFDNNFLMLDNRYAVMQDEKGLHLTDVLSWASFSPIKIGRQSNATIKGLQFQLGQYKVYIKQLQGAK